MCSNNQIVVLKLGKALHQLIHRKGSVDLLLYLPVVQGLTRDGFEEMLSVLCKQILHHGAVKSIGLLVRKVEADFKSGYTFSLGQPDLLLESVLILSLLNNLVKA